MSETYSSDSEETNHFPATDEYAEGEFRELAYDDSYYDAEYGRVRDLLDDQVGRFAIRERLHNHYNRYSDDELLNAYPVIPVDIAAYYAQIDMRDLVPRLNENNRRHLYARNYLMTTEPYTLRPTLRFREANGREITVNQRFLDAATAAEGEFNFNPTNFEEDQNDENETASHRNAGHKRDIPDERYQL